MDMHLDSIVVQTVALLLTAFLLPRFEVRGPFSGLLMVLALSYVNTHLWDAALFYSIPNTLTSQTVVTLLVNAVLFWLLAKLLPGIHIRGIFPALLAPLALTVISILTYKYARDIDWSKVYLLIQEKLSGLKSFSKGL